MINYSLVENLSEDEILSLFDNILEYKDSIALCKHIAWQATCINYNTTSIHKEYYVCNYSYTCSQEIGRRSYSCDHEMIKSYCGNGQCGYMTVPYCW